jgi:hypothetical protein
MRSSAEGSVAAVDHLWQGPSKLSLLSVTSLLQRLLLAASLPFNFECSGRLELQSFPSGLPKPMEERRHVFGFLVPNKVSFPQCNTGIVDATLAFARDIVDSDFVKLSIARSSRQHY